MEEDINWDAWIRERDGAEGTPPTTDTRTWRAAGSHEERTTDQGGLER
jgi:hypothetical protein